MNDDEKRIKARIDRRRVQIVTIGDDDIIDAICGRLLLEGLPEDAEFVSAFYSLHKLGWELKIRHPSFESVPEGGEAPNYPYTRWRIPEPDDKGAG